MISIESISFSYGEKKVLLTIDSTSASVNGRTVTMPIAAKIINDKTCIWLSSFRL